MSRVERRTSGQTNTTYLEGMSAVRHMMKLVLLVAVVLVLSPDWASAQARDLGSQGLGRAYWHVFAAYAVGWVFIAGWVVSLTRRLGRIERDLSSGA